MWGYLWSPDQLSLVLLHPVPHLQCSAQECILIDVNFITAPPPPTEFECNGSSIYDESMTLTWKEPATPNGYIENYIIYDATRNMSIPTNGSVLKQLIVNLSPGRKNVFFFLLTWPCEILWNFCFCGINFHASILLVFYIFFSFETEAWNYTRLGSLSDYIAVLTMSTGSSAQDQNFVRTSKFFIFCLDIYIYIYKIHSRIW